MKLDILFKTSITISLPYGRKFTLTLLCNMDLEQLLNQKKLSSSGLKLFISVIHTSIKGVTSVSKHTIRFYSFLCALWEKVAKELRNTAVIMKPLKFVGPANLIASSSWSFVFTSSFPAACVSSTSSSPLTAPLWKKKTKTNWFPRQKHCSLLAARM